MGLFPCRTFTAEAEKVQRSWGQWEETGAGGKKSSRCRVRRVT